MKNFINNIWMKDIKNKIINMCKIRIDGVNITLTKEQLQEIDKQRNIKRDYKSINSIEAACEYLDIDEIPITASEQLKIIARAINSLIDNEKFPDFKNESQRKWYPYHKMTSCGLVFYASYCHYYTSNGQVAFTKNEESSNYLGTHFIKLYEQLMKEY